MRQQRTVSLHEDTEEGTLHTPMKYNKDKHCTGRSKYTSRLQVCNLCSRVESEILSLSFKNFPPAGLALNFQSYLLLLVHWEFLIGLDVIFPVHSLPLILPPSEVYPFLEGS